MRTRGVCHGLPTVSCREVGDVVLPSLDDAKYLLVKVVDATLLLYKDHLFPWSLMNDLWGFETVRLSRSPVPVGHAPV